MILVLKGAKSRMKYNTKHNFLQACRVLFWKVYISDKYICTLIQYVNN